MKESEDPRQILEKAAERRAPCELLPRRGGWGHGLIQRVERGGIVLLVPTLTLQAGEDLRCWLALDGRSFTFQASVIRTGIAVSDRSQKGYLLGFIDSWTSRETAPNQLHGLDLAILPPNGPPLSLVHGPAHLVDLSVDSVSFTLPSEHKLVFVRGGEVRLRYSIPGLPNHEAGGHVSELVPGEALLIYTLRLDAVSDTDLHRKVATTIAELLEMGKR